MTCLERPISMPYWKKIYRLLPALFWHQQRQHEQEKMQETNVRARVIPHKTRSHVGIRKTKEHPDGVPHLAWLMDSCFPLWAVCPISSGLSLLRDSPQWDQTRHCEYHKEHEHTIEECRHFRYLVEEWWESAWSPNMSRKVNDRPLGVTSKLQLAWFSQVEPYQSFTSFKEGLWINAGSQSAIDEQWSKKQSMSRRLAWNNIPLFQGQWNLWMGLSILALGIRPW